MSRIWEQSALVLIISFNNLKVQIYEQSIRTIFFNSHLKGTLMEI